MSGFARALSGFASLRCPQPVALSRWRSAGGAQPVVLSRWRSAGVRIEASVVVEEGHEQ